MQTSGLVLDDHDDFGGAQLRSFFPAMSSVPGFIKQAQALSAEDRDQLPDDAFALVMLNGEEKLRKFACIDSGNTALSVLYFVKNASKLPPSAQQVAAENLKIACGWYGLDVPRELEQLSKTAGIGESLVNYGIKNPVRAVQLGLTAPAVARGTGQALRENSANFSRAMRSSPDVYEGVQAAMLGSVGRAKHGSAEANLNFMKFAAAFKQSEVSGTATMPYSASPSRTSPVATVKKTSSIGRLVQGHRGDQQVSPDVAAPVMGKSPVNAPQHMSPVVDVSDAVVKKSVTEKKASRFAMPSLQKYPIDNYVQVKQASLYFDEYAKHMAPSDRREFCVNLVKRASELSVAVSPVVKKYGAEKYASIAEVEAGLGTRRQLLSDERDLRALNKIASVMAELSPAQFANTLSNFDSVTGLNRYYDSHVIDPYYTTFGFEKKAEDDESWGDVVGNYVITKRELDLLAQNHLMHIKKTFGADFAEEFKKDPVGIYASLPVMQKKLVIRLATENAPV